VQGLRQVFRIVCTLSIQCLQGKISIRDIVGSKVMAELLALQSESFSADKPSGGSASASGGKSGAATPPPNWFSSSNALRVYGQYLELDTDMNGMLSKEEMQAYGKSLLYIISEHFARFEAAFAFSAGGTFTKVFFDRLFQECLTYGGEMVGGNDDQV
jgi:serine/threonine-protein phosphatase 2A regulatory subunit B''